MTQLCEAGADSDGLAVGRAARALLAVEHGFEGFAGEVVEAGEIDAESGVAEDLGYPIGRVIHFAARRARNGRQPCGCVPGHTHLTPLQTSNIRKRERRVKSIFHNFMQHMGWYG